MANPSVIDEYTNPAKAPRTTVEPMRKLSAFCKQTICMSIDMMPKANSDKEMKTTW